MSKRIISFLSILIITFLATTSVFAKENVLRGIELSQKGGVYQLKLKTDSTVPYKRKVDSNDSIYFELKNTTADQNVETLYDNVDDVDGVIIQQIEDGKLRIYVNGLNTSNTKLFFEKEATATTDEIILNRPKSEYAPVDTSDKYEEKSDWGETGFNLPYLMDSTAKGLKDFKIDYIFTICAMVILASLMGLKAAFSGRKRDLEPLIKLPEESPPMPEIGLPPRPKMNHTQAPMRPVTPMANYGLNTYQKSQTNPYTTRVAPKAPEKVQKPAAQGIQGNFTTPMQRARAQATPSRSTNLDSKRFLESVSKIYEQNGRKDLATGLKANLNKSKIAM